MDGMKITNKNREWIKGMKSLQITEHITLWQDWGFKIMDIIYIAFQRIKYRFNGQFSFYKLLNKQNMGLNHKYLKQIIVLMREWNVLQFDINISFEGLIEENKHLFIFNPTLMKHMEEFIWHMFQGIELNAVNVYEGEYESEEDEYYYGADSHDSADEFVGLYFYLMG